jgi:hypothetical protein
MFFHFDAIAVNTHTHTHTHISYAAGIFFDEFQRSEGGLFVDMTTFLAFGKDYVGWNYEKTGNPVYLHIKQTRKVVPEDRPLKKPTLLAIGTQIFIMVCAYNSIDIMIV